jgi:hypothetical protein
MAIEIKIDYETNRVHMRNPKTGEIIVVGAMAVWLAMKERMKDAPIYPWPSSKPELLPPHAA